MIISLVVIAITLNDLVLGFHQPPPPGWEPPAAERPTMPQSVFPTVPNLEMDGKARSPNRDWTSDLDTLVSAMDVDEDLLPIDPQLRAEVLARLEARRTYPGAKPVKAAPLTPHPVDPDVNSCYQCHGEQGKVIGTLVAPPLRHKRIANCGRCHKSGLDPLPGE